MLCHESPAGADRDRAKGQGVKGRRRAFEEVLAVAYPVCRLNTDGAEHAPLAVDVTVLNRFVPPIVGVYYPQGAGGLLCYRFPTPLRRDDFRTLEAFLDAVETATGAAADALSLCMASANIGGAGRWDRVPDSTDLIVVRDRDGELLAVPAAAVLKNEAEPVAGRGEALLAWATFPIRASR